MNRPKDNGAGQSIPKETYTSYDQLVFNKRAKAIQQGKKTATNSHTFLAGI